MILSPKLIEVIERVINEDDTTLADVLSLDSEQTIVLLDLERKLYAVRRCLVKRYIVSKKGEGTPMTMLKPLLLVGSVMRLKREVLNNPIGVLGVVYEGYKLADLYGVSIIFPNGAYDGFSPAEQDDLLEYVGHNERLMQYDFKNVTQLMEDFRHGMFDAVLQHRHYHVHNAQPHEDAQS